ncbi:hypothetical protein PN594_18925 [Parabacteroides merdae]|nr:hypothetical protein [Parabacteroides merdae]
MKDIDILSVNKKQETLFCYNGEQERIIKGLDVEFDLHKFKGIKIYIPDMKVIEEHMIRKYIIDELGQIYNEIK